MIDAKPPKPTVAFFDFTSCEGCQLTVLDALQTHPELLDVIEIVEFREAMTGHAERYDIAFIEGSCTRASDESRLLSIRARAAVVIALGSCAHIGGINAIRNKMPLDDVRNAVYGKDAHYFETYPVRPLSAVIPVDYVIPGCPINPAELLRIVTALLQGRSPEIPDYPVCIECKLRETVCAYQLGRTCLGPVTRAGCQAQCPSSGYKCVGCRGLLSNSNMESLKQVMSEHGLSDRAIENSLSMFLTWQVEARRTKEAPRE